jgi:nucleotide-binding universal stress UspA family protein
MLTSVNAKVQRGGTVKFKAMKLADCAGRQTVGYKTLLVHGELGRSNAHLLRIAGDLAGRFDAGVIGVAMCQPMRIIYSEGYVPGDLIQQDLKERDNDIAAVEVEFRDALQGRVKDFDWRSAVTDEPLSNYLARQACSADLIVTGVDRKVSAFDTRHLNVGDLAMQAGRPVLVIPETGGPGFKRVLVGWKDTREARRAITDALPFLTRADYVGLAEIAPADHLAAVRGRLAEVAVWLSRHGITAKPLAVPSNGDDALQLRELAREHDADMVVAGAFGHSPVREWVFGGVTRDLLLRAGTCALVSH